MTKDKVREFVLSAYHSFVASFVVAVIPLLSNFTLADLKQDALKAFILGVLITGFRAGSKAIYPYLIKVCDYIVSRIINSAYNIFNR
jgi:hypothetical protein